MRITSENWALVTQDALQISAIVLIAGGAVLSSILTILAFSNLLPWVGVQASAGATPIAGFGMYLQIGVTALLVSLCLFIPSSLRVLKLEGKHREFSVGMNDVARAYAVVHQADRGGSFELEREFDAVRERFQHLRRVPDFAELSNEILVIAAQMSAESRDLAEALASDKIAHAKGVVERRRAQVEELEALVVNANEEIRTLRRDLESVEIDESVLRSRIQQASAEIEEISARLPGNAPAQMPERRAPQLRVADIRQATRQSNNTAS